MKQGLLLWSSSSFRGSFSIPFSANLNPKVSKPNISATNVKINSVNESPLTVRERRQMRNEKRDSKPAYNWKEEVEDRLIKKPKKRYASWTEELNLDNLALLGTQWWVVRVSRVLAHETAERMALSLSRNFPSMDFKVYIPSVRIKRKLKNGSLSIKPKPLFPGCVFLRCVMDKQLHDFIRECNGVGGFVGSKVGNTKRQINKPRPVDADDMDAIFKQAKEEQEKADQSFEDEEKHSKGAQDSEKGVDLPMTLNDINQSRTILKPRGRGRKSAKQPVAGKTTSLVPGSMVQVVTGAYAGFSGTLKKLDESGLATIGFTLFGKETLADVDVNEILAEKLDL